MKTLITLFFALIVGATTQAQHQHPIKDLKIKTIATSIVGGSTAKQNMVITTQEGVSVIYIFKNAKIKKALSFDTTKNKTKLV